MRSWLSEIYILIEKPAPFSSQLRLIQILAFGQLHPTGWMNIGWRCTDYQYQPINIGTNSVVCFYRPNILLRGRKPVPQGYYEKLEPARFSSQFQIIRILAFGPFHPTALWYPETPLEPKTQLQGKMNSKARS